MSFNRSRHCFSSLYRGGNGLICDLLHIDRDVQLIMEKRFARWLSIGGVAPPFSSVGRWGVREDWPGATISSFGGRRHWSSETDQKKDDEKEHVTPFQPVKEHLDKSAPGYPWKWRSFLPEHTYRPNLNVDLKRHQNVTDWSDRIAYGTVKFMRVFADAFFKKRYGHRAVVLETVAAVPGMVGGMLLHLRCLRRFRQSGGWIRVLLDEAENERMHLMTYMAIAQPSLLERALVISVQGGFFAFYTMLYIASPRTAHRIVGYLEEEAVISYTQFLEEIDKGKIENIPAPPIAIDYWQLGHAARLRDVVLATRADEANHRDVNHLRANILKQGKNDPAPYAVLKHDTFDPNQKESKNSS